MATSGIFRTKETLIRCLGDRSQFPMIQNADTTFIRRVRLQNYKSIAACDVHLGPLTFLVGPNGAGKSNFLDALRLVADALRTSLDHAVRDRGGIEQVRRRSSGHPTHFGIRLDFALPNGVTGYYAFKVGAKRGAYEVQTEECSIQGGPENVRAYYRVRDGEPVGNLHPLPAAAADRLYLVNVSGLPAFRPVYESLSRMGFYNMNPDQIRDLQPPDAGEILAKDGRNIASVLAQLEAQEPDSKQRIEEYLSKVVPGIKGVQLKRLGPKESLEFKQEVANAANPWNFLAANMSDGTLRALGVLVALFQSTGNSQRRVPLVGIEEPEVALHPSAAGVLMDSLRDASLQRQVLVTSHSPDLLEDPRISGQEILAVIAEQNETKVGRLDETGRSTLRDHLYTAGELLRTNQLLPEDAARSLGPDQLRLFDAPRD